MESKSVLILSGGMDSTTLLYYLLARGDQIHSLSFDYGQRHSRELDAAKLICNRLAVPHQIVNVSAIKPLLRGSALTDAVDMPHGHYAADNMKLTVVPNRNAIMLSLAYAYAVSINADSVSYAAHAGDHFIYPDCRPEFVANFEHALQFGNDSKIRIETPFLHMSKGQIAALGLKLGVPFSDTWTCYEGDDTPCGKCGACDERKSAFEFADALQ